MKNKYLIISAGLLLVCILGVAFISSIKMSSFSKKIIPHTNTFMELLKNENYEKLLNIYSIEQGKNFEDLKNEFGTIKSYKYIKASASSTGWFGQYQGFFVYYLITFDPGKSYQGSFQIRIDKENNLPVDNDIKFFNISGDFGEKSFYMKLKKKDI